MSVIFEKIGIFGIGLIGGSIGMAIKKGGLVGQIVGFDINRENLETALELKAIDAIGEHNSEIVSTLDMVILAAPISVNISILKEIVPYLKEDVVVTDVGSTKGNFIKQCEEILGSKGFFIGGHPMAGSEAAGIKGADPYLFENALYILTPTEDSNPTIVAKLKRIIKGLGAKLFIANPEEHDLLVATVSHLPHLIAATLVNTAFKVQENYSNTLLLAAGGFKDTTRIASGNPDLWRDICFNNKEKLLEVIKIFQSNLEEFEALLYRHKDTEFRHRLNEAKRTRDEIPVKLKGYWPFLEEVIVTIPDKPGMIAHVATILSQQGINIDDIEILRVREGEGGSLRLGFAELGSGSKAAFILRENGIVAREK